LTKKMKIKMKDRDCKCIKCFKRQEYTIHTWRRKQGRNLAISECTPCTGYVLSETRKLSSNKDQGQTNRILGIGEWVTRGLAKGVEPRVC